MRTVSLMYHDVVEPGREEESGFAGGPARIYKLSTDLFKDHLDAIAATGASICNDIAALTDTPVPQVVFTFDDGGSSFLHPIADLLEARNWRGHFFITTGQIGASGFLTAPQLCELARRGHTIGSHSVHHPTRMANLSSTQLAQEWCQSKARLEDILGMPIHAGSVPGGYSSYQVVAEAARAGYQHLFHSDPITTVDHSGPLRLYGRFPMQSASPASLAAGLAQDEVWPRSKIWALRNLKKAVKAAGGNWLIRLHSRWLESHQ